MHLFRAICVFLLILAHVGAWGALIFHLIGRRYADRLAEIALAAGLGIVGFSAEILLLGHLHGLLPGLLIASALLAVAVLVRLCFRNPDFFVPPIHDVLNALRRRPILAAVCLLFAALLFASGLRAPRWYDELHYHWPSPQLWASAGGWVASPFRHSNGPILMHALYTVSAVWDCPTAAHWTHTLMLGILVLSTAALARAGGGQGIAAVAACLSVPCIATQSAVSYTDVACAAMVLTAFVALFCRKIAIVKKTTESDSLLHCSLSLVPGGEGRGEGQSDSLSGNLRMRNTESPLTLTLSPGYRGEGTGSSCKTEYFIAGLLLAGAFSIKPFAIVALPFAILFLVIQHARTGGSNAKRFKSAVVETFALVLPVLLCAAFWSIRTHWLIGRWWDTQGIIVHDASEQAWQMGWAAGRIPNLRDLLTVPLIPLIVPLFGEGEPFGGKVGLLLLVGWPTIFWVIRRDRFPGIATMIWMLCAAATYFLLLSPFMVKTRFHNFVWAAAAGATAIAFDRLAVRWGGKGRMLTTSLFAILVCVGMLDSSRVLVRGLADVFR